MHAVSILHMDIKPDNWLLTSRPADETSQAEEGDQSENIAHSLSLIDFGRAIDLSIFPQNGSGVAFSGQCCPSNFSCPAMTEVRCEINILWCPTHQSLSDPPSWLLRLKFSDASPLFH